MPDLLTVSRSRRFKNDLKAFFTQPANIILAISVVVLGFFTLYPLILLVADTFKVHIAELMFSDLQGLKVGAVTGFHWTRMLFGDMSSVYFWKPLGNSLLMSLLASIIAILYGGVVAFLITRTDMKAKKFLSAIFVFPYIMPSWTLASFWKTSSRTPT